MTKGIFPQQWKIGKVTPLYKQGPADDPNNYRPITVIPTVGKVLERLVYNQMTKYLNDHKIITETQAGFREGRSTGTCLIEFLHNIYGEIDRGGACGVLFLDLAKAFDTVHHLRLIDKLKSLSFRGSARKWFTSY